MAGPLGIKADERQLSALELMMEHADNLSAEVLGAPRSRRRRASKQDQAVSARDFMQGLANNTDFEDYEYYVGPGSRALNRELRERRAAQRNGMVQRTPQSIQAVPQEVARPNDAELEHALENIFTANAASSGDIVDALHQSTEISAQTAKTLHEWMEWEKAESFKNANRARTEDAAPEPTKNLPAVRQSGTDLSLPDADFPDEDRGRRGRRGRRYGRDGRPRREPRTRGFRGRGKWGALAGLAAVGGAFWWANHEKSEQDGPNGDEPQVSPAQPQPEVARQEPKPMLTQEQKDMAFDATSLGALAIGGAKRIPFVGPAVALAGAGYNAEQIANDDTLSEQEKKREQTKNITGAAGGGLGATAGAWIGGTLGSVVPGAGTLAGAALGSVIGGLIGDALGDKIGDAVADKMDESNEKAAEVEKQRQDEQDAKDRTAQSTSGGFMSMMPNWFSGLFGSAGNTSGGGGNRARPAQFDSKQINDFAAKAAAGGLGSVSAQFESGGRGVSTVSSGAGDYGGVSYGAHQLASNNGSMMNFLNSKEGQPFLAQFGGQAPGSAGFTAAYKNLASTQGDALAKAQDDYITRTHYAPQAAKLQNDLGLDVSKRGKAVQEMVYSTAVQYGGNTNAIKRALQGLNLDAMTDSQIINTVQQSKAQNVGTDFKSSSANVQAGVAARAENERKVLEKMSQDEVKQKVTDALTPDGPTATPQDANVPLTRTPEQQRDAEMDRKVAEKFPELNKGTGRPEDYQVKPVDSQPVPDLTARGPATPRMTPEEYARHMDYVMDRQQPIRPVEQASAIVDRQPLVTAADIPDPDPQPTQTASTAQPDKPRGAVAGTQRQTINPGGGAAKTHSLDDFPVFLDDPTLQMINVGYM
ncbi:putative glycosyl hydrolase family containing protein [Erwinia phage pEa_SNUABM_5]|uniref:Putative glycosyl hydrolase family containing protein n=1 Tax=Erwinia phage pEa_SNUABM_5 TaxID=2797313 RepID=A0A7T8EPH1_9CAUD|nr:putative glycosyl hydrolase family containing protein [Erwinia phage pEa_SNUABM_5]QQO90278.1 putative glycosyl hydrolase family containing protein [Erwinia phage pEa_SNUABM_5]